MTDRPLYADLGLTPEATATDIKAAYYERARTAHPDAGGSKEAFQKIQRAYETLSNPDKRKAYDETGRIPKEPVSEIELNAYSLICGLFEQVVENALKSINADIFGQMNRAIDTGIASIGREKEQFERKQERVEAMNKRLKYKGGDGGMLTAMFSARVAAAKRQVQERIDAIAYHKRAKEILTYYEWEYTRELPGTWTVAPVMQSPTAVGRFS